MCSNNTLKVYKSVADCDFSAFYPSTCCHNNISPEIITDDIDKFTNKYTIDIAF